VLAKQEVKEAILNLAEMLNYSLLGHIVPKSHFFEVELGVSQEKFAQVFIKHPWVLGLSLESEIRHSVQWLMDFGADKDALADLLLKFPLVLGYSIENNFKPKIDYFTNYLGTRRFPHISPREMSRDAIRVPGEYDREASRVRGRLLKGTCNSFRGVLGR